MKIKRIVYTILLIIWMIVIFLFSNQNGEKSKSTSDKVASNIIGTVETVTKHEFDDSKKNNLIDDTRVLVRKAAHFFLYFTLGILSYLTFKSYGIDKRLILYSILFCFVYAISDEVHQLFSDGRSFQILDILIDTSGSSVGCLLSYAVNRYR